MSLKKNLQKKKERGKKIRSERARQSQLIDAQCNMDLAFDAYTRKDYNTANLHVTKALRLKPDWHQALRLRAGIALQLPTPDLPTACHCLEKVVPKDPDDISSLFSLAHCYFKTQRHAEEIALLEGFLERSKTRRDKETTTSRKQAREWLKETRSCLERRQPDLFTYAARPDVAAAKKLRAVAPALPARVPAAQPVPPKAEDPLTGKRTKIQKLFHKILSQNPSEYLSFWQ